MAKKRSESTRKKRARKPTPKQMRFCKEYVIDLNATAAYIRAGYSEGGASPAAYKLLRIAHVEAAIAKLQAASNKRVEVTVDNVKRELGEIAFAKLGDEHVSTGEKRLALADLGRHVGMFPRGNGAGAKLPVVNIYNVTQDQVAARMDEVFKDAAVEQAAKRRLDS